MPESVLPPPDSASRIEMAPPVLTTEVLSIEAHRVLVAPEVGAVAIKQEAKDTGSEVLELSREEKLFAPLPDYDAESTENIEDYSYLFADEEAFDAQMKVYENERLNPDNKVENMKKRAAVTRESQDAARLELTSIKGKDAVLDGLLDGYQKDKQVFGDDMLKALRTDPQLRLSVGKRLLEVVNANMLGVRPGTSQKRPDAPGYEDMPSDMKSTEYVSVLMLSMLDGTFKPNSSDPIKKGNFGEVTLGFHRSAAERVLREFRDFAERVSS